MVTKLKAPTCAEELGDSPARIQRWKWKPWYFQLDLSFFSPQPFHFPTQLFWSLAYSIPPTKSPRGFIISRTQGAWSGHTGKILSGKDRKKKKGRKGRGLVKKHLSPQLSLSSSALAALGNEPAPDWETLGLLWVELKGVPLKVKKFWICTYIPILTKRFAVGVMPNMGLIRPMLDKTGILPGSHGTEPRSREMTLRF